MNSKRLLLLAALSAMLAFAAWNDALACACCTNDGQRRVGVEKFDSGKFTEIEQLKFAATAQLFTGERDPSDIKGIATPSASYALQAAWAKDILVFTLRDKNGGAGTLSLQRPATVSILEVDPRDSPDRGHGPGLYKEWKLTSRAAGTGIFSAASGPNQLITLIVQGRGNSCTSANDFSHWTLAMQGPKASYTFFGELVR